MSKQQQLDSIAPELANVIGTNALQAVALSYGDKYLFDLLVDWYQERDNDIKKDMAEEIENYTLETMRQLRNKKES